jgi:hypothetical protein
MANFNNSVTTELNLLQIKQSAKQQFLHLSGVEGFGIGDGVINVYVSNPEVIKQLPTNFQGVTFNCIQTGMIEALTPSTENIN